MISDPLLCVQQSKIPTPSRSSISVMGHTGGGVQVQWLYFYNFASLLNCLTGADCQICDKSENTFWADYLSSFPLKQETVLMGSVGFFPSSPRLLVLMFVCLLNDKMSICAAKESSFQQNLYIFLKDENKANVNITKQLLLFLWDGKRRSNSLYLKQRDFSHDLYFCYFN